MSERATVDRDRREAARRRHVASISRSAGRFEAVAGHRKDDGQALSPIVARPRPACAAADVGSTNTPCANSSRIESRISPSLTSTMSSPVSRIAARISAIAAASRSGCLRRSSQQGSGGDARLACSKRVSERRAQIALHADQPRIRSIMPPLPGAGRSRCVPEGSVPPPQARRRHRALSAQLFEHLVGEGRRPGQECGLPEVRGGLGPVSSSRCCCPLAGCRPESRHGDDDGAVRPGLEQLGRRGVGRHEQREAQPASGRVGCERCAGVP